MAINDEIKVQKKKLREMNGKGKAKYIWDYYKIHIIVGIIVIIAGSYLIRDLVRNNRPEYIYVSVFNTTQLLDQTDGTGITSDFASYVGVDTKKTIVTFDEGYFYHPQEIDMGSMGINMKILAMISAGTLDAMMAPDFIIEEYGVQGGFADLRNFYTREQMQRFRDAGFTFLTVPYEGEELPVGLSLTESPYLQTLPEGFPFSEDGTPYIAFASNAPHPEANLKLVEMLTGIMTHRAGD